MKLKIIFILLLILLTSLIYSYENPVFSKEELDFIKNNPVLNVVTDDAYAPIDYRDKYGNLKGISYDYLDIISEMTGLKFKNHYKADFTEILIDLKNGVYDLIPAVAVTEKKKEYLLFSDTYLEFPAVIFSSKHSIFEKHIDEIQDNSLIVVKDYSTDDFMKENYPDKKITRVATIEEALEILLFNKNKMFLGNLGTAMYFIQEKGYTNISIIGDGHFKIRLSIGISPNKKILQSILNKCIKNIEGQDKNNIYKRWIPNNYNFYTFYLRIFSVLITTIIFILFIFYLFNKRLKTLVNNKTKELINTKNVLKGIIDSMPSILFHINSENRIMSLNSAARKFFDIDYNVTKSSISLENILDLELEEIYETIEYVKKTGEKKEINKYLIEHINDINEKEGILFNIMIYPLGNDKKDVVLRFDDITGKTKLENMIMHNEKMMSLGGLAAGMAHEINNPLSGIIQSVQNLKRRLTDSSNKQNLNISKNCEIEFDNMIEYYRERKIDRFVLGIEESVKRAADIVNNMLAFSRKSRDLMEKVVFDDVINNAVKLASIDYDMKKKYDFRHIKIEKNMQTQGKYINCIAVDIEQVILNILRNAAQAMCSAGIAEPVIKIKTQFKDGIFLINISDNGPGMSESIMKRIFEPFFTTKSTESGTGLGMSVSYYIIKEKHNGEINVTSELGKGTVFTIKLPE